LDDLKTTAIVLVVGVGAQLAAIAIVVSIFM